MSTTFKVATVLCLQAASIIDEHQASFFASTEGHSKLNLNTQIPLSSFFDTLDLSLLGELAPPVLKDQSCRLTAGVATTYPFSNSKVFGAQILFNRHQENLTSYLLGLGGIYQSFSMQLAMRWFSCNSEDLMHQKFFDISASGTYAISSSLLLKLQTQLGEKVLGTSSHLKSKFRCTVGLDFPVHEHVLAQVRLATNKFKDVEATIGFVLKARGVLLTSKGSSIAVSPIFLDYLSGLVDPDIKPCLRLEKSEQVYSAKPRTEQVVEVKIKIESPFRRSLNSN